ncbi:thiol-disulfide oxidoreductase DCC family protein [Pseudoduganella sp. S-14]|uniref:thiol-disulfide oxidoreductase DCC family protein n=1 Tax=unclassified Pseudoduganella TaxID=2637179 RepID=UPI003CF91FB4
MAALTLFFDNACPFCRSEMSRLRRWDRAGRLAFVDIAAPGFDPAPLGTSLAAMNTELHGLRADGAMLVGTDAILAAYTLAGRAWLVWPLRVAALRPMLAAAYRSFARNRYRISRWLRIDGARPACDGERCQVYFGGKDGA